MNTDEITRRLDLMGESYKSFAAELLPESEVSACMEAKNLAIQAVKLLEKIEQELQGKCVACKHLERHDYEPPCFDCIGSEEYLWEFRWPLGKDTAK